MFLVQFFFVFSFREFFLAIVLSLGLGVFAFGLGVYMVEFFVSFFCQIFWASVVLAVCFLHCGWVLCWLFLARLYRCMWVFVGFVGGEELWFLWWGLVGLSGVCLGSCLNSLLYDTRF